MTEIRLPWPPAALSPNSRLHWSRLAKAKKIYRRDCWIEALSQKARVPKDGKLRVDLTFYRPSRRAMDRDNLLARMKAGLDGVADALKTNDSRFDPISVSVSDETGGYVMMYISWDA